MCCLTIYKTKDDTLIFTHNRDEQRARQISASDVVTEIILGRKVWMPKDLLSNGTWIATDGRMVGAILNGFKKNHVKKSSYKASRGSIIPTLFGKRSIDKFIGDFNPEGFEPFTLVISDKDDGSVEYGWDGNSIHLSILDLKVPVIYSSSTLYDAGVVSNREALFSDFILQERNENDIWNLHATKGQDHSKFLHVDNNATIGTVAMSQIVLGMGAIFKYTSLIDGNDIQTIKLL